MNESEPVWAYAGRGEHNIHANFQHDVQDFFDMSHMAGGAYGVLHCPAAGHVTSGTPAAPA